MCEEETEVLGLRTQVKGIMQHEEGSMISTEDGVEIEEAPAEEVHVMGNWEGRESVPRSTGGAVESRLTRGNMNEHATVEAKDLARTNVANSEDPEVTRGELTDLDGGPTDEGGRQEVPRTAKVHHRIQEEETRNILTGKDVLPVQTSTTGSQHGETKRTGTKEPTGTDTHVADLSDLVNHSRDGVKAKSVGELDTNIQELVTQLSNTGRGVTHTVVHEDTRGRDVLQRGGENRVVLRLRAREDGRTAAAASARLDPSGMSTRASSKGSTGVIVGSEVREPRGVQLILDEDVTSTDTQMVERGTTRLNPIIQTTYRPRDSAHRVDRQRAHTCIPA